VQKRPIILRRLLIEATPYLALSAARNICVCCTLHMRERDVYVACICKVGDSICVCCEQQFCVCVWERDRETHAASSIALLPTHTCAYVCCYPHLCVCARVVTHTYVCVCVLLPTPMCVCVCCDPHLSVCMCVVTLTYVCVLLPTPMCACSMWVIVCAFLCVRKRERARARTREKKERFSVSALFKCNV